MKSKSKKSVKKSSKKTKKTPKKRFKLRKLLKDKAIQITIRYLILLALMFTLPLIYKIFAPLTIYPTAYLLKIFYNIEIAKNLIIINNQTFIKIIPACIAGSAYLLLLILNLSIPINIKKRIKTILLSFAILLILNIIRIFALSIWYHEAVPFFDFTHKLFWYGLSTIFVIAIWFYTVKKFKIKEIPIYTDLKFFMKNIKKK